MKFILFCCSVIVLCFAVGSQASGLSVEQHRYLKKTGTKTQFFDWRLEKGSDLVLTSVLGTEHDVTRMKADFSTYSWTVDDPAVGTHLSVSRNGKTLIMHGMFKGKKIQRTVTIDEDPWYQALSISLRQFVDPQLMSRKFWTIRSDTLDVYRLQVHREEQAVKGMEGKYGGQAIRLKIQLTGFRAAFWSCHYWLRKMDGVFLRYEGPSGPPGWPMTTVKLIDLPPPTMVDARNRLQREPGADQKIGETNPYPQSGNAEKNKE